MKYNLISLRTDLETIRDRLSLLEERSSPDNEYKDLVSDTFNCIEDTYQSLTALINHAEYIESMEDIEWLKEKRQAIKPVSSSLIYFISFN